MADVKISALPAATTPLAGTEVLPIVQSSTTRQVSVANLTAGRAVNALSITASSLTSGRVTYAGTAGLLSDSANLVWDNTNARLGIGTSSPSYPLSVAKSGNSSIVLAQLRNSDAGSSAATSFAFGNDTTAEAARILYGSSTNSTIPNSLFITNDLAGSIILRTDGTERMRIDSAGNVTLQKNISVGAATPTTSGSGITFPATQDPSSNANTLDDYEEGSWTPIVEGSTTAGTATYSSQIGRYTKIGNTVRVYFAVAWTGHTGAGTTKVGGFPFTSNAGNQTPFSVFTYGETFTANNVANGGIMPTGSTVWEHWQVPVGGGISSGIPINSAAEMQVSGVYQTA